MKVTMYVRLDSVAGVIELDKKGNLEKGLDEVKKLLERCKQIVE